MRFLQFYSKEIRKRFILCINNKSIFISLWEEKRCFLPEDFHYKYAIQLMWTVNDFGYVDL